MNLLVKKIECRYGVLDINYEYEDASGLDLEDADSIRLGIYNKKQKVDYIFDDIKVRINNNHLSFMLDESIRDFFLCTNTELAQLYIECMCNSDNYNDITNQLSETQCITYRYYIKDIERSREYVCNYSKIMRLYFSKAGLLSTDNKSNAIASDDNCIFLKNNNYSIYNNKLTIIIPVQQERIYRAEVLIAVATDYYNVYSDIIENYITRFEIDIYSNTVNVDLQKIFHAGVNNNTWYSVQILLSEKRSKKRTRILIGENSYKNGFCLYDLRQKGYELKRTALDNYHVLYTESNLGFVFSRTNDNTALRFPLCSVRLMDIELSDDTLTLLIDSVNCMGRSRGIIIEDLLGQCCFIEADYYKDYLMSVTIDITSLNQQLVHNICRVYLDSDFNSRKWMIPIVLQDGDEEIQRKCTNYNNIISFGLCNELILSFGLEPSLVNNNRISTEYIGVEPTKWGEFPRSKGGFYTHANVINDYLIIYMNNYEMGYIKGVEIVARPNNPIDNYDYLILKNLKPMAGGYAIDFNKEEFEYIASRGICRMFIYIKTDYYEYFMPVKGIDKKHRVNMKSFFDRRSYFLESFNNYSIENTKYEIQPYFSFDGILSIHSIKPENRFKGQMSAQIEDVSIDDGVLIVIGVANEISNGSYAGICISYRNRTEEDAVKIVSNDIELRNNETGVEFIAHLDLKELPVDGATWDIRLVYMLDGNEYLLNSFLKDDSLRTKFRNPYNKDEFIFDDGTIVYPYCTYGNTVALLRREYYEEYDSESFRLQETRAIEIYREKKEFYDSQNIVLIFEKFGTCSDNAYHLFKYCMDNDCEKQINSHIYYIIEKDSIDYKNVQMYEDHLLEYGSIKHQIYLLAARLYISSDTNLHAYVYRVKDSYIVQEMRRKKYIFIDHGIAALKNGSYIYGKGKQGEPTWYTVSSEFQKELIKKYYKLSDKQLKVTGLARWDALEDRSGGRRKILIAPTWRRSLEDVSDEKFLQSLFCQRYMELLKSSKFAELLETYNLECDFYMHLKFIEYLDVLKKDDLNGKKPTSSRINICSFGEKPINDLYMECSMMITDYSSVAFDTLWQNKPVIFYQFDIDDFDEMWGSMIDMEKDLPGDRISNLDDLLNAIEDYISNDFCIKKCYSSKAKRFFKYVDHNNCERIWRVVEDVWKQIEYKKDTEETKNTHPYLIAAREGKVGMKTILSMLPRWLEYKVKGN